MVALHFHPSYALRTIDVLSRIADDVDPCEVVLVANSDDVHARLAELAADRMTLIRHDNIGTEFGGYQAGLDHLLARHDLDWVFVANDTVANTDNYSPQYHQQFTARARVAFDGAGVRRAGRRDCAVVRDQRVPYPSLGAHERVRDEPRGPRDARPSPLRRRGRCAGAEHGRSLDLLRSGPRPGAARAPRDLPVPRRAGVALVRRPNR